MGSWFAIDVTDLKMFSGYDWWDLTTPYDGPCDHATSRAVIGWGPTVATYELVECSDCKARAWEDGRWTQERQRHSGLHGFWNERMQWFTRPASSSGTDR